MEADYRLITSRIQTPDANTQYIGSATHKNTVVGTDGTIQIQDINKH